MRTRPITLQGEGRGRYEIKETKHLDRNSLVHMRAYTHTLTLPWVSSQLWKQLMRFQYNKHHCTGRRHHTVWGRGTRAWNHSKSDKRVPHASQFSSFLVTCMYSVMSPSMMFSQFAVSLHTKESTENSPPLQVVVCVPLVYSSTNPLWSETGGLQRVR